MLVLDFEMLLEVRDKFLSRISVSFGEVLPLFLAMSELGLRFSEAYELKRWEVVNNSLYRLKTAKKGEFRFINVNDIPELFLLRLQANLDYATPYSYSTVLRIFNRYYLVSNMKVGRKGIGTHIFRHLRAKDLYTKGYSIEDIQLYFGHIKVESTLTYINSSIYI